MQLNDSLESVKKLRLEVETYKRDIEKLRQKDIESKQKATELSDKNRALTELLNRRLDRARD